MIDVLIFFAIQFVDLKINSELTNQLNDFNIYTNTNNNEFDEKMNKRI